MRVLVVHNQLWAHYKSKLFSEINKVFIESYPGDAFQVLHIGEYEVSRKGMYDASVAHPYQYPYKVLFRTAVESISFRNRFSALLHEFKAFNPTVLNITGYFDWAQILLMFYARSRGVKVVISTESSHADQKRSGWKERLKSLIVNRANSFFCFGTSSAFYLRSLGVAEDKIAVKHAAVVDDDTILSVFSLERQSQPESRQRKFIYVGRLAPEKNLELLISAFLKANPADNPWQLLMVGTGPSEIALRKMSEHSEEVVFAGAYPWYKIPDFLAHSDILVLPSKSEPWGLVVNEAMVCGMPVIVSDKCGCAPDLVFENENGYTFDPDHEQELVDLLSKFIKTPEMIAKMGRKSLDIIQPYSARAVAVEMAQCYKKLDE